VIENRVGAGGRIGPSWSRAESGRLNAAARWNERECHSRANSTRTLGFDPGGLIRHDRCDLPDYMALAVSPVD